MAGQLVSPAPLEATAAFGCSNTARCTPTFHSSYSNRLHWKASSADEQDDACEWAAFGACFCRRKSDVFSREIVNETVVTGSGGISLAPQGLGLPLRLSCLRLSKVLLKATTSALPGAMLNPLHIVPLSAGRTSWLRIACLVVQMGPSKGRGPLIAKYAPVGFKKGFGAVGLGRHSKKGEDIAVRCRYANVYSICM